MPGASFHSCRGSTTIAASPVSSLPPLLLVFLGAERWECAQLESWQPAPLSFLLSLSHKFLSSSTLPGWQGWGWGSHSADEGGGVRWGLLQAPGCHGAVWWSEKGATGLALGAPVNGFFALIGKLVRGLERAIDLSGLKARWPLVLPPPPALVSVLSRASCTRAVLRRSKWSWAGGLGLPLPSSQRVYIGAI